jgi:pyruvate dehydrogenase E2 component (dihydrolipoamide acetyltransferase)
MPVEVILPVMGETMDKGKIVKWFVQEGQRIEKGEPLYQIETDKAVLDVEAPARGVVQRIFFGVDAEVPVLSVVALIAGPGEDAGKPTASAARSIGEAKPIQQQTRIEAAEEKPASALPAQKRTIASPRARRAAAEKGLDLSVLKGTGPGGRVVERDVLAYTVAQPARLDATSYAATTPTAKKAAATAGLEISGLRGTGPGGRITRADVEGAMTVPETPAAKTGAPSLAPDLTALTGLRRIIAERMSASAHTAARVTLTTEVDATALVELRMALKQALETCLGFAISYTDILVALAARALGEYRYMNVRLGKMGIETLPHINIGVAVDTERGLLVPVVRNADQKGIADIARSVHELAARARQSKSMPDDLTGGTFTITNLGMYEVDAFTPIINLPECAILGVGRIHEVPAVYQGQVCVRSSMVLSLAFDHRLVDGAPAARFLHRIKDLLEQPYLLLA